MARISSHIMIRLGTFADGQRAKPLTIYFGSGTIGSFATGQRHG